MGTDSAAHRRAKEAVTSALGNEELMRQLDESLEAERRGDLGTSLKDLQAQRRTRRLTSFC